MGKKKRKKQQKEQQKKQSKLCDNCIQYQTSDKPNKIANLGFRVVYTLISWLWLGAGVVEGNTFFVSIGLFVIPLLVDYVQFNPEEKWRKALKWMQICTCIICLVGALFGMLDWIEIFECNDVLYIKTTNSHILFNQMEQFVKLRVVYNITSIFVFMTFLDWVASPRKFESNLANLREVSM